MVFLNSHTQPLVTLWLAARYPVSTPIMAHVTQALSTPIMDYVTLAPGQYAHRSVCYPHITVDFLVGFLGKV